MSVSAPYLLKSLNPLVKTRWFVLHSRTTLDRFYQLVLSQAHPPSFLTCINGNLKSWQLSYWWGTLMASCLLTAWLHMSIVLNRWRMDLKVMINIYMFKHLILIFHILSCYQRGDKGDKGREGFHTPEALYQHVVPCLYKWRFVVRHQFIMK